ncbi:MAG TPA: Gldg family protein [Devosia sp.]|jgi:ABC-type uncharacterized transport system involved in gliding motility auxiliary subunit/ABC-type transport system involved in multi-copper enzyme maturation permease subunit|nr:Gldg family protein [Devosia sp.]
MNVFLSVVGREFRSYFSSSLAIVFLVVFLGAAGALTLEMGGFLSRGQADLQVFFGFHPWLYLVLMPAIGMRLWADERRYGTIELLMTLPVTTGQAVTAKFLAAWLFAALGLALTFPIWLTVNYLGQPDNGVIFASYLGSLLMGGAFLALACCISALTNNQVTAFVLGVTAGFLMLVGSLEPITAAMSGWAPQYLIDLVASLSFAERFGAITRGALDARDVVFFLSFIVLLLFLNVRILDGNRARGAMSEAAGQGRFTATSGAVASALAVVLFLSVNAISDRLLSSVRIDLTERQLYTLSPGTVDILAGITEPVTLHLYRSADLVSSVPTLQLHDKRVGELLGALKGIAGDKIRLETHDVTPFSPAEDEALGYQMEGIPLGASGERGYYGIVGTNSLDSLETIPFLSPSREDLLQYDLARMIFRLAQLDEPMVRSIDGLGMFGSMSEGRRPWAMLDLIGANFALERVDSAATEIPADTDVLLVTHPVRLQPATLYAIDQFALGGGSVLLFIDPLAENSAPNPANPNMPLEPSSDLGPLMTAWGVGMDPTKVVGDRDMAIQTVGMAGNQRVVAPYLPWLRIGRESFSTEELTVSQLDLMRMSSAGSITAVPDASTTLRPLIQSSTNSMLLDQAAVAQRVDPNVHLRNFEPSGQRQVLAARLEGNAGTAFPDGPPEGAGEPGQQLQSGSISVIVVADTDLLSDSHVVDESGQISSNNPDFVLNAIEELSGGDALASIRGGGISYRPFTTINAIQASAERTYRATEQRLSSELEQLEAELAPLQGNVADAAPDQQATVAEYNSRILELRQQLREVRAALRSEIETLENWLRFINIALVPILLIVVAIAAALWRRAWVSRYQKRALAAHAGALS